METAKLLYRRLDSLFGALNPKRPQGPVLESFLEDSFRTLKDDLRLRAALLYSEKRDDFALARSVGDPGGKVAESLDSAQVPVRLIFQHRVYIFQDPDAEGTPYRLGLLPRLPVAAIVVGRRPTRHILFYLLDTGWQFDELDFSLNTVRAAVGSRLFDARVRGSVREAAEIQQSLLEEPPDFPGFDLAARSVPAEEVGGDFFDFHAFDEDMLGVSIGDASGHGLPAALLVRDVVTGLRMGLEKELKIATVFAKLNRVIHRSNMSSRFISVFYGELEADGNLIYVNAGHPPPLIFSTRLADGPTIELTVGGTVIGPLPKAQFRRGFARVRPGEVLVMCTDGILERRDAKGEFFGEERLRATVRQNLESTAEELLERVFSAAFSFGLERPWEDDATIVVVRRLTEPSVTTAASAPLRS
jgi:sigma-B regulation protein RsbU (phosphoserine phosphatase)